MFWKLTFKQRLVFALFAALAAAARVGRAVRRAAGARPRIARGPVAMVGLAYSRKADRLYGYRSDVIVHRMSAFKYPYVFRSEFDHVVAEWKTHPRLLLLRLFATLVFRYDILVTFFDGRFFRDTFLEPFEATLLRLSGVKVVAVSYGSDVQQYDGTPTRFDWIGRQWKDYAAACGDREAHNAKIRAQVDHYTRHADLVIAGDYVLALFMPRYEIAFKYFPVDADYWKPERRALNARPVVVHAPNHRFCKGTDILIESCDRLRGEGVDFELTIVEGVPRNRVKEIYAGADVVAEQFVGGIYGLTALEGMALGKPVLTYLDEDHLRDPVFNLPVVNTHRDNMDDVLRVLLALPELRERLGRAGREAIERYQSFEAVGEVWDRIYRHLWRGEPLRLETTRMFEPGRRARSLSEDPRDLDFWPVDVGDLLGSIDEILRRPAPAAGRERTRTAPPTTA